MPPDRNLGLLQAVQTARAAYEGAYDTLLGELSEDWLVLALLCAPRRRRGGKRQRPSEDDLTSSRRQVVEHFERLLELRDRLAAAQKAYDDRQVDED